MTPSTRPPAGNLHDGGAGDRVSIPPSYHRGARGGGSAPPWKDSFQRRNLASTTTTTRSPSPEPEKRSFQATKNIPAMKPKETIPAANVKRVVVKNGATTAPSSRPDARVPTQTIQTQRGVTTGARVRSGNGKVPATIAKTTTHHHSPPPHATAAAFASNPPTPTPTPSSSSSTSCLCGRRGVILEKCNLHHVKECQDCHSVPPPSPPPTNNNNNNNNNNSRPRRMIIEKCNLHKIQGGYYCGECTSSSSSSPLPPPVTVQHSTANVRAPKQPGGNSNRTDNNNKNDDDGIRVYKVTQVY